MSALTDGLRFCWTGDSPTTSTGPDSGTVTLIGSPSTASTAYGTGVVLNGSSQAVDTGKKFTSANGTMFLLVGSAASIGASATIACQTSDDAGSNIGIGVQSGNYVKGGSSAALGSLTGDLWLAWTWGAAGMKAYVGATEVSTNASTTAPAGASGAYTFHLGCFHYSGGRIFFHGSTPAIFAAFDAQLSAAQIAALVDSDGSTLRAYLTGGGGPAATAPPPFPRFNFAILNH